MTRDIYVLFDVKRARRRRSLRIAVIGFVGGLAIGGALLFLPPLLAPEADQLLSSASPVMAMSPEQPTPSAALHQRVAVPVMGAPVEIQPSDCGRLSVHDGDTFRCDAMKVRLVALSGPIDAPELPSSPRCKGCDPVPGYAARDRLRIILKQPAQLLCKGEDRYQRRLCRVTVNGRDVGDILVAEELAVIRNDWR